MGGVSALTGGMRRFELNDAQWEQIAPLLPPLPAALQTMALYLTAHADAFSMATLTRRLSSVAVAHRVAGHPLDTRHPDIRRPRRPALHRRRCRHRARAELEAEKFSGHSLRAGFATAAAASVEERAIMKQTRHRSSATVRRYIRDGELFARNLSQEVGL
ncbi:hypothetical protein [Methylobacterium oryzisoli]|uniref:hypothetical protein n=1 Tax=Methylobacterium oryzisoli TaxID=3385502 RepID=UPI003892662A